MVRAIALGTLLAGLAACSSTQIKEHVHRSVLAGAAPVVSIGNTVGEIVVNAWGKREIDVDAVKSANSIDAVRNMEIAVSSQGNTVTIETKYHGGGGGGVRYAIVVPSAASLEVTNTTGAIRIDGVGGNVIAATQTGEIRADLGRVAGRRSVDLTATTGSVRLAIAPDSDARVEAQSSVGAFSSDFPSVTGTRDNVVGERASGTIGKGTATIHLRTTTGSIALRR